MMTLVKLQKLQMHINSKRETGYGVIGGEKRLAQELEELQGEYDDIKPLTPTGTISVKWAL